MNILLLIFNYCLFVFIIIFTFKNLYESFYTKKTYIGAIILILCILGMLSSYTGVKMSNDLVIRYVKFKYKVADIIKSDLFALFNILIAFIAISCNKKKEKIEREKYFKKDRRNSEKFFSVLRNKKDNTKD